MKRFPCLLLIGAALAISGTAMAADQTTSTFRFSDPSQPGQLRAVIGTGEIRIRGEDVSEVTVRTSAETPSNGPAREDGLRVIATSAQYSAVLENNVLSLEYGSLGWTEPADFDIVVPSNTSIQLQTSFGGQVHVENVTGDVEIKNLNGEITLRRLGGGAIVETMNGKIDASFTRIPTDKPLAFSSMNGEIRVRVPADAKANVRFRTQNGAILTDFAPEELVTRTDNGGASYAPVAAEVARAAAFTAREAIEVARNVVQEVQVAVANEMKATDRSETENGGMRPPRPPRAPRPPSIPAMAGGKVVSGTLNGGGSDIHISTMNGNIVVRKLADE